MAQLGLFQLPRRRAYGPPVDPQPQPPLLPIDQTIPGPWGTPPNAPPPAAAAEAPKPKPTGGMFAQAYKRPPLMNAIGATLQDISAGLDRREGGNVDRLIAGTRAEQDDENYRTLIGGMEMDPLEQMLAARDPNGYLAAKFKEGQEGRVYDRNRADTLADATRERGWTTEDRDLGFQHDTDMEEARAGRPRIDNTGQSIIWTDPKAKKSEVLYTDPDRGRGAHKTFRAMTPAEVKARGWPDGATGQIDSDGRAYQDKSNKPQSPFSQTEIRSFRGKADGLMTLGNAVDQYMNVLEQVSPKLIADPWDKEGVQKLQAAHGLITSAIKDADSLGALDQGVQNLVNSIIADPVGFGTFGKDVKSMKAGAQQIYDSIDYKLGRIPEQYRGGATGETTMAWRIPDQVRQAQAALQNWDHLPAFAKTPQIKQMAEKIVADFKAKGGATVKPNFEDDPTDDEYDAAMNSYADIDLANPPEGVDAQDWDYLTDEEKRAFMSGGQ